MRANYLPTGRYCAVAIIMLASAAGVFAQYPVQQDGHALDSNFGVGQFGVNNQLGVPQPVVNSGNLIVSGNVTRGAGFRGVSPIRDYSYLSFNVPSASLNSFLSDSISVNQLQREGQSGAIQPQAFFAPNESVVTGGAIASGLLSPSTAYIRPSTVNIDPRYSNLSQTPYQTNIQSIQDTRLLPSTFALRPDVISNLSVRESGGLVNPALVDSPLLATNPALQARFIGQQQAGAYSQNPMQQTTGLNPMQSPLDTGGLTDEQRDEIAGTNRRRVPQLFSDPNANTPPAAVTARRTEAEPVDRSFRMELDDNGVYQAAPPQATTGGTTPAGAPGTLMNQPREPIRTGPKAGQMTTPPNASNGAYPPAGTLPAQTAMGETGGLTRPSPLMTPVGQGTSITGGQATSGGLGQTPRPVNGEVIAPQDMAAPSRPAASQQDLLQTGGPNPVDLLDGPVTTLAGGARTRVNDYLRKAEELLKQGDYFRASSQYDLALLVDRNNPVIWLGRGNALAAAGDYASAVRSLLVAINGFDRFAELNLDLNTFIPDSKLLESRRADLESRLAEREHTELRFLLGYLEYYSGLERFGIENLKKAASMAKTGTTIARFPTMLEQARGPQE